MQSLAMLLLCSTFLFSGCDKETGSDEYQQLLEEAGIYHQTMFTERPCGGYDPDTDRVAVFYHNRFSLRPGDEIHWYVDPDDSSPSAREIVNSW